MKRSAVCSYNSRLHTGITSRTQAFVYRLQPPRQTNGQMARFPLRKWEFQLCLAFLSKTFVWHFHLASPDTCGGSERGAVHCNSYFRPCKVNTTPRGDFLIMNTKEVSALIKLSDDAELSNAHFFFFFCAPFSPDLN